MELSFWYNKRIKCNVQIIQEFIGRVEKEPLHSRSVLLLPAFELQSSELKDI